MIFLRKGYVMLPNNTRRGLASQRGKYINVVP